MVVKTSIIRGTRGGQAVVVRDSGSTSPLIAGVGVVKEGVPPPAQLEANITVVVTLAGELRSVINLAANLACQVQLAAELGRLPAYLAANISVAVACRARLAGFQFAAARRVMRPTRQRSFTA